MLTVWAEDATLHAGWVAVLAIVLPALGVAGKYLFDRYWPSRKEAHEQETADLQAAVALWKELTQRAQELADRRLEEVRQATATCASDVAALRTNYEKEIKELREGSHRCDLARAKLEGDMRVLQATVRWLQGLPGEGPPAVISPGVIIMDLHGKVRIVSPSTTPLLHWLPADLIGKDVEVMVPERHREARKATLRVIEAAGDAPWPGKVVQTEILSKEGEEVPVTVMISAWPDVDAGGSRLVCWEIVRRPLAPGGST